MFELFFGILWTLISGFSTLIFCMSDTVIVNGQDVSKEEFSILLWPKLFFGLFLLIGIIFIVIGVIKIIRNRNTDLYGEECYGRICNIYNSGAYVNGRAELKADVLVYIESLACTKTISEVIGFDYNKYPIGSYVRCKYFNDDINVESIVNYEDIPIIISEMLPKNNVIANESDTILVDGVEYVRKDSLNKF